MFYQTIANSSSLQAKFASIIALLALLGNFWVLLGVTYIFIVADFYYGYRLSRKVKKENPESPVSGKLESGKWWHTIVKGKDAGIFIALACLADTYILPWKEDMYFGLVVTGFICGAEFWSMLENQAYLSDAKWALWLRKYVKNKAEKHFNIDISE